MYKRLILSLLIVSILITLSACDPSYNDESALTEEEFKTLSLNDQLNHYLESRYTIDRPAFMSAIILSHTDSLLLIFNYLEGGNSIEEKYEVAGLLFDLHISKGAPDNVLPFLESRREIETDPELKDYYSIIIGRLKETPFVEISPAKDTFLAFKTNDKLATEYLMKVKKIFQKEFTDSVDNHISFIGYTKGMKQEGYLPDYPKKNVFAITYVVHLDWVNYKDTVSFNYIKDGRELTAEEIVTFVKVPKYFNEKVLTLEEIENILEDAKLESPLNYENEFYRPKDIINGTILNVYATINEKNNECAGGTMDLRTGKINVGVMPCFFHLDCCQQCKDAFSQSVESIGIQIAQCGVFSSSNPMGSYCADYFKKNPQTVEGCQ